MKQGATRERFVRATATLLQERGYAGTGMNDILEASGAPRGSLYFHFPGGKAELAVEAIKQSGSELCDVIRGVLEASNDLGEGITTITTFLGQQLVASDYKLGCPVAPLAIEGVDGALQDAVAAAFEAWHVVIRARLVRAGHKPKRATELATFALSAIEGALLLCKVRRSVVPLEQAAKELSRIAAPPAKGDRS
ncbi:MAG: TetR/AcrR family transcriptional regulator [Polyangiaceae bacterium]